MFTNILIIYTRDFITFLHLADSLKMHLSFFSKAIGGLYHRGSQKYLRFTIYLLVLTVSELYNISDKNQLPNKSRKYLLFYTRPYIPPLFSRKIGPLYRRGSRKHLFFTTFSLVLRMGRKFNITNKYQFPNQSAKNVIFSTKRLYISPLHISLYSYLLPSRTSKVDLSEKIVNSYTRK